MVSGLRRDILQLELGVQAGRGEGQTLETKNRTTEKMEQKHKECVVLPGGHAFISHERLWPSWVNVYTTCHPVTAGLARLDPPLHCICSSHGRTSSKAQSPGPGWEKRAREGEREGEVSAQRSLTSSLPLLLREGPLSAGAPVPPCDVNDSDCLLNSLTYPCVFQSQKHVLSCPTSHKTILGGTCTTFIPSGLFFLWQHHVIVGGSVPGIHQYSIFWCVLIGVSTRRNLLQTHSTSYSCVFRRVIMKNGSNWEVWLCLYKRRKTGDWRRGSPSKSPHVNLLCEGEDDQSVRGWLLCQPHHSHKCCDSSQKGDTLCQSQDRGDFPPVPYLQHACQNRKTLAKNFQRKGTSL